jgi:hypothetical protein
VTLLAADHFPALVAGGAAVVVAFITAVTTHVRQSQQLRHERELKDLDVARALLDDMQHALNGIAVAQGVYQGFVEELEAPPNDQALAEEREKATVVWQSLQEAYALRARLLLRAGPQDPTYLAFTACLEQARAAMLLLEDTKSRSPDQLEADVRDAREQFFQHAHEFQDAARRLAGWRTPQSG